MTSLPDVDPAADVGSIVGVEVDGASMAAIRHRDGWVLVPDTCPHAKCPFTEDGELVDGTTLICNCHGSEFDLVTGHVLQGPAESDLEVIALQVDAGGLEWPE